MTGILSWKWSTPASMGSSGRRAKYSRMASLTQVLTRHAPPDFSATRTRPRSSRSMVSKTARAVSPSPSRSRSAYAAETTRSSSTRSIVALRCQVPARAPPPSLVAGRQPNRLPRKRQATPAPAGGPWQDPRPRGYIRASDEPDRRAVVAGCSCRLRFA